MRHITAGCKVGGGLCGSGEEWKVYVLICPFWTPILRYELRQTISVAMHLPWSGKKQLELWDSASVPKDASLISPSLAGNKTSPVTLHVLENVMIMLDILKIVFLVKNQWFHFLFPKCKITKYCYGNFDNVFWNLSNISQAFQKLNIYILDFLRVWAKGLAQQI